MKSGRQKEQPLVDPQTYPHSAVCLRTAAAYLGLDARTVRARIEAGELEAVIDRKVYRIPVSAIHAYESHRRSQ